MGFVTEVIGYGMLIPAAVSVAVLVVTRKFCPNELAIRSAGALALGGGFIVGYCLLPWAPLLPNAQWHWIPYLSAIAIVSAPVRLAPGASTARIWSILLLLAGLAAWLLVPSWAEPERTRHLYAAVVGVALLFLCGLLEPLAKRSPGALFPLLLCVVSAVGAVVLGLSGSVKFAQLAGVVAAAMGGCTAVSYFYPSEPLVYGAMATFSVLLGGLMFTGYVNSFSDLPMASYLLVPAAPLALWLCVLPAFGKLEGRSRWVAETAAVLVPLLVALALAALSEEQRS